MPSSFAALSFLATLKPRCRRHGNKGNDIKLAVTLLAFACIGGCITSGSAVVTGQERSPIDPAAVTLYIEPPAQYDVVGIVDAVSDIEFFDEAAQERAFVELKKQAAKIGANGVIEWEIDEVWGTRKLYNSVTGDFSDWPQLRKTIKGTAIYVTLNSRSE